MNKRIRDLALECSVEYVAAPAWAFTDNELEKFADLLIQECCNAIRQDDAFNGGKFMRTIKQHFEDQ